MEEKGAWEWAPVPLDGSIYGFQASGQRQGTSLEVPGVVLGQRSRWLALREKLLRWLWGCTACVFGWQAPSSSLLLDERGVIARTKPKKDLQVSDVARWSICGSYHCNKPSRGAYGANFVVVCLTCQEAEDFRLA